MRLKSNDVDQFAVLKSTNDKIHIEEDANTLVRAFAVVKRGVKSFHKGNVT